MPRVQRDTKELITFILKRFEEDYPDNIPKKFFVDKTLKFFTEYLIDKLRNEKEFPLFGIGRFYVRQGISGRTKKFQYYLKFKFNTHFVMRYRQEKGTATDSEKRTLEKKQEFISNMWNKRIEYMQNNSPDGELPKAFQKYKARCDRGIHV